jgi:hypothetical protein
MRHGPTKLGFQVSHFWGIGERSGRWKDRPNVQADSGRESKYLIHTGFPSLSAMTTMVDFKGDIFQFHHAIVKGQVAFLFIVTMNDNSGWHLLYSILTGGNPGNLP